MPKTYEYYTKCKYVDICWRNIYSRYILENYPKKNLEEFPMRFDLVLQGYTDVSMTNDMRKGLYMETMPKFVNGTWIHLCPVLRPCFVDLDQCNEYTNKKAKEIKMGIHKTKYGVSTGGYIKVNSKNQKRTSISRKKRYEVADRCGYTCVYCQRNINSKQLFPGRRGSVKRLGGTIDHFIPVALGGDDSDDNLVLACRECNRLKGMELWKMGCRKDSVERK